MKRILFFLAAALLLASTGCAPGPEEPAPPVNQDPPEEEILLEYQVFAEMESLPGDIPDLIPFLQGHRGYKVFSPEDYDNGEGAFILVFAGEKPTGGYDLAIDMVEAVNDRLRIVVAETEPQEGEHVIQVLTYPARAVQVSREFETYEVVTLDDKHLRPISSVLLPEIEEAAGIYQGLQDSSSLEILVEGQPMALRFLEHQATVEEEFEYEDAVVFRYYQNEHGQKILLKMEKR